MLLSLPFVEKSFRHFNRLIFGGKLPMPKIAFTHARTFRGKLVYRVDKTNGVRRCSDYTLRLSLNFDLPQDEWEDVIIHEMIHLHIAVTGLIDTSSHGEIFRKIMDKINRRHNRRIVIAYYHTARPTPLSTSDDQLRAHYLCIARLKDGRYGVAPATKTRIFELWDYFESWEDIEATSWVLTINEWFNRFPRVMKPKLYIVSREDLSNHLSYTSRLKREGNVINPVDIFESAEDLIP